VVVWLNNAIFVVINKPHHAPLLDRRPDLRIGFQRHLYLFSQRIGGIERENPGDGGQPGKERD